MSGSFAAEYYLDHLASTVENLEPLRVLIDCANGAASTTARYLFGREFLSLFANDPAGIEAGLQRTRIMGFSYAVSDDTQRDALQRIGDALSQLR